MGTGKMSRVFFVYSRFIDRAVNIAGVVGAFLLLVVTLITFYEVIMRYVFNAPTTWSIDYSIYLIMWGTFLGAAFTLKQGAHIHVDILVKKFPKKTRMTIEIVIYSLILIFCTILAWRGFVSCLQAYLFREITLSYTRTPLYIPSLSIPFGASLLILEILRELVQKIHSGRS